MYKFEEVYGTAIDSFKGDDLATKKWIEKYCLKDQKGKFHEQTPDEMHRRMAREFGRIEGNYPNPMSEEEIYSYFKDFKYIVPQGSPMYGIGNDFSITSLSNCFVIDNSESDSYGGIMLTDQQQVQLMKRRGGVGHDLSHLRPAKAFANNAILGDLAGMVLYMERYSNSTREVSQDGRRGALMLSISVKHPDAEKFIDVKLKEGKVTGANISVKMTDEFMERVRDGKKFIQTFPINLEIEYHTPFMESIEEGFIKEDELYNLEMGDGSWKGCYAKLVDARRIWMKIIENAWKSAEPGILFWDTILRESPADCYAAHGYKTVSTNPCGEIPLSPFDSCRLLCLNLYSYVENPFTSRARLNLDLLKKHTIKAQRLMDDLVDLELEKVDRIIDKIERDPEPPYVKAIELNLWKKIRETAVNARRTGLGVLAEADMIAALGIKFGTDESIEMSEKVHEIIATHAYKSSIIMAEERGAFPIWDFETEKNNPFIKRIMDSEEFMVIDILKYENTGRRNISLLTIAPTGTTSLMTQTSSGIEPVFLPYYRRRAKTEDPNRVSFTDEVGDKWEEFNVVHPKFVEWYRIQLEENYSDFRVWYDGLSFRFEHVKEWLEELSEGLMQVLFEQSPYFEATANDIDWVNSVKMQGRIQRWVDHSISKTVNLPKETTKETVNQVYLTAHEYGCKGITIYRDGSRSGVLVGKNDSRGSEFDYSDSFKRPEVTECDIYHKTALKQDFTVIVGKVNGRPFEIFTLNPLENHVFPSKIKSGTITKVKKRHYRLDGVLNGKHYRIDNIVDFMSDDDRVNTKKISALLRHGMHPKHIYRDISEYASIVSFDKIIQRVLKNYLSDEETGEDKCPECGSTNYHSQEACWHCNDCGFQKCG